VDGRTRDALAGFIRRTIAGDLDEFANELEQLRKELHAVRLAAKLPVDPRGHVARRDMVVRLREQGMSERGIAKALGIRRGVVTHDLRVTGVPRPTSIVGLDGRSTRGPARSAV
jgi:hypothetical protein